MLYIVPTPVGNLADMTPRALEVLKSVSAVYAEDTRTSGVLMKHFGITTPLLAFHKFNEHAALDAVMARLESGDDIALVSDAGTPGISDPGFMLARECRRRGLVVETLPGPTAFVPALVSSGLPCDRFFFEGFLPPKKGRASRLQWLAELPSTFIIYESPLRTARALAELAEACGGTRPAAVAREISKVHETIHRGTLDELAGFFAVNQPKGEIVIVVAGKERPDAAGRRHRNKYRSDDTAGEPRDD